jgi:HSP20 family protein
MSNVLSTYFNNMLDDDWFYQPLSLSAQRMVSTSPALNIEEKDDLYMINMMIPGLDPNKIKVELQDHTLTISYTHEKEEKEKKKGKLLRQEYSHYSFSRSVTLPKNVDSESVNAKSEKGILTIEVKKLPENKPKTIDIKIKN